MNPAGKNPRFFKTAFLRAVFLAGAAFYFCRGAANRGRGNFFDNVNLVFHEAGHVIFSLFGEVVCAAGGTIMQLLVPVVLVIYFWEKKNRYAAGIVMLWLGESSIGAARYAGDAVKLELPLLGDGTHDWTYLLSLNNLLGKAQAISDVFYYSGIAIIITGIIIGVLSLRNDFTKKNGNQEQKL